MAENSKFMTTETLASSLVYSDVVPRGGSAATGREPHSAAGGCLGLVDESGDFLEGVHPAVEVRRLEHPAEVMNELSNQSIN